MAGRLVAHGRPAQLGEGLQIGPAAEPCAGAGRGDAAEWRDRLVVHRLVVDVDDAGRDPVREFQAERGVTGDDAEGESVRAVGGQCSGLVQGLEGPHGGHRAEDLLGVGRRVVVDVGEDGGR